MRQRYQRPAPEALDAADTFASHRASGFDGICGSPGIGDLGASAPAPESTHGQTSRVESTVFVTAAAFVVAQTRGSLPDAVRASGGVERFFEGLISRSRDQAVESDPPNRSRCVENTHPAPVAGDERYADTRVRARSAPRREERMIR
jgi:hypothetical protein